MTEFFEALVSAEGGFLRLSLLAGLLASPAFGAVGSLVVARRISGIAGALSHSILAGIGAALFAQTVLEWSWCSPLLGALLAGVAAAAILTFATTRARQREDTWISFLWAGGVAVGLLFMAKTPVYVDPMAYLFGNILLVGPGDIWLLLALNLVIGILLVVFYQPLLAVCFDERYARVSGQQVTGMRFLLLLLTALTVVLMVQLLGVVLVIALLVLPSACAGLFVRRLWPMMALGAGLCAVSVFLGLWFSYGLELPSGPVIIVVAGVAYVAGLLWRRPAAS